MTDINLQAVSGPIRRADKILSVAASSAADALMKFLMTVLTPNYEDEHHLFSVY